MRLGTLCSVAIVYEEEGEYEGDEENGGEDDLHSSYQSQGLSDCVRDILL